MNAVSDNGTLKKMTPAKVIELRGIYTPQQVDKTVDCAPQHDWRFFVLEGRKLKHGQLLLARRPSGQTVYTKQFEYRFFTIKDKIVIGTVVNLDEAPERINYFRVTGHKLYTGIVHSLKTWPEYYKAVKYRAKSFEVRKYDRDYQAGDILLLEEYKAGFSSEQGYTGDWLLTSCTYLLEGGEFGVAKDHCVMAISHVSFY